MFNMFADQKVIHDWRIKGLTYHKEPYHTSYTTPEQRRVFEDYLIEQGFRFVCNFGMNRSYNRELVTVITTPDGSKAVK